MEFLATSSQTFSSLEARSPLDPPDLRTIDECLSNGELTQAQHLLGALGPSEQHAAAMTYLATRLLYLRDRLDPRSVAERLEELLRQTPDFPEAAALLRAASRGIPGPESILPRKASPGDTVLAMDAACGAVGDDSVPINDRPTRTDPLTAAEPRSSLRIVVDTRNDVEAPTPVANPIPAMASRRPSTYSVHTRSDPTRVLSPSTSSRRQRQAPAIPGPAAVPTFGTLPPPRNDDTSQNAPGRTQPPAAATARTSRPPSSIRSLAELTDPSELWPPEELAVFGGDPSPALEDFTRGARSQLSHLPPTSAQQEFELLGLQGAELLNKAGVTHHFAPFDVSLHSLARLEAAIATLCGMQSLAAPDSAVELLLGSYVGEVLRRSHRGEWMGTAVDPTSARVRSGSYSWRPFTSVHHWLRSGGRTSLLGELSTGLARLGTVAWKAYASIKVTPRPLWQGELQPHDLNLLGRAVADSVLSRSCELLYAHSLDHSIASLDALDQLLRILFASPHPLTGREAWLQRTVLWAGAYVGSVLTTDSGMPAAGTWSEGTGGARGDYSLSLPGGKTVAPMAHILTRAVAQRPLDLELFANLALDRGL